MLTSVSIENFKAWKNTGKIHLAPLTVIFGANSAGKSSLGHLLLALKQTAISTDRQRALHLGDENTFIDLGTFKECIFNHDLSNPLNFCLEWQLPTGFNVKDPLHKKKYQGDSLKLAVSLLAGKTEQPEVTELRFDLGRKKKYLTSDTCVRIPVNLIYNPKAINLFGPVAESGP
jgi:hypothetical protein